MNIIDVKSSRDKQNASTKLERSRFESELGVAGGNAPLYVGMTISALLLYLESVSDAWADAPARPKPRSNGEESDQGVNTYDLAAQMQSYDEQPTPAADDPLEDQSVAGRVAARAAMRDGYALGSNSLTEFTPSSIGPTNGPVAFSVFPTNDNPLPEISASPPRRSGSGGSSGSADGGGEIDEETEETEEDVKTKPNQRPVTTGPLQLQAQFVNTAVLIALTDLIRNASDAEGDKLKIGKIVASSAELRLTSEGFVFDAKLPGMVTVTYEISDGKQMVLQTAVFDVHVYENHFGTSGDDAMSGTSHRDHMEGGSGDDTISAGADMDEILGGTGNDIIYGGDGNDIVDGGDGDDVIYGGAGNDIISGGSGNDRIYGEDGDDVLLGDDGDDYLDGGIGSDHVDGGSGDDTIVSKNDGALDFYDGGEGTSDQLDVSTASTGVTLNLNTSTVTYGAVPTPTPPSTSATAASAETDLFVNIEEFNLTDRNDTIVANVVAPSEQPTQSVLEQALGIIRSASVAIEEYGHTTAAEITVVDPPSPVEVPAPASVIEATVTEAPPTEGPQKLDAAESLVSVQSFDGNDGFDTIDYSASDERITVELAEGIVHGQDIGIHLVEDVEAFIGGSGNDVFNASEVPDVQDFAAIVEGGDEHVPDETAQVSSETPSSDVAQIDLAEAITNTEAVSFDLPDPSLSTLEVATSTPVDNTFIGGDGEDTLSYGEATESVTIDLAEAIAEGEEIGTDSFDEIETFVGGAAADTFLATEGPMAEVEAPLDHTFIGGAGEDTLSYEDATQSVTIDIAEGIAEGEEIGTDSFSEVETFVGGAAADTFLATEGPMAEEETPLDHTFIGGAGEDTLSYEHAIQSVTIDIAEGIAEGEEIGTDSFSDVETFVGGAEADTFLATEAPAAEDTPVDNTFIGGAGEDTLSYEETTASVAIEVAEGTASGTEIGSDAFTGIENFILGSGDDTVRVCVISDDGDRSFSGGTGNDTLSYEGTTSQIMIDVLNGTVSSEGGTADNFDSFESVVGGDANDTIIFGVGVVSLDGGGGSDTFIFMAEEATLTTDGNSGRGNSGTEIRNFEVGDVVRIDRFDIFSRAIDRIEDAFEDFIDDMHGNVDEDVYGDDIPIRIRTELAEEMWRTFIDADFDRDSVYEFSITIDGNHDLIITQTNTSNTGNGHA
jgi:Ca2+-binding RTX toxin-like protein